MMSPDAIECLDAMETGDFDEGQDKGENESEDTLGFQQCDEIVYFSDYSDDENYVNAEV